MNLSCAESSLRFEPLPPNHVIALSRGGLHSYENVRLAHWICNARKGAGEVMPNAFT